MKSTSVLVAIVGLITAAYADQSNVVGKFPHVSGATIAEFRQDGDPLPDMSIRLEAGRKIARAFLNGNIDALHTRLGFDQNVEHYEETERFSSAGAYGASYAYDRYLNGLKLRHGYFWVSVGTNGTVELTGNRIVCSTDMLEASRAQRKTEDELVAAVEVRLGQAATALRNPLTGKLGSLEVVLVTKAPYVVGIFRAWKITYYLDARTGDILPQGWGDTL